MIPLEYVNSEELAWLFRVADPLRICSGPYILYRLSLDILYTPAR